MEGLAKRIAKFMWGEDTYHAKDSYDSIEELITEITKMMYLKAYRIAVASSLKSIIEFHEDDETASEASLLYREVVEM